jgi:hypothetical protein
MFTALFIISEEEVYIIGFVEFDMQLFRRKRLLLRIYSSARNENQKQSNLLFLKHIKQKKKTHRNPTFLYRHLACGMRPIFNHINDNRQLPASVAKKNYIGRVSDVFCKVYLARNRQFC